MKKRDAIIVAASSLAVASFFAIRTTQVEGLRIDHFDHLSLERGPCFSTCPVYGVFIDGDGTVRYKGRRWVKVTGSATARLSPQQLDELIAALNSVHYFALRDRYASPADGCGTMGSDLPSAITSVTVAGRTKTIWHEYGCLELDERGRTGETYPRELTELESRIDAIVGTERWVGAGDERHGAGNDRGTAPN